MKRQLINKAVFYFEFRNFLKSNTLVYDHISSHKGLQGDLEIMKYISATAETAISLIVSYIAFYYFTGDFISLFWQGTYKSGLILYTLAFIAQSIFIYTLVLLLQKKEISKIHLYFLWVLYFCIMMILLFGRYYLGTVINLNPLSLFDFSFNAFFQNLFNLILFIPIGLLFKDKHNTPFVLLSAIVIVTLIELIQLVTKRGIFDITDIILNSAGITIGFLLSNYIPARYKPDIF